MNVRHNHFYRLAFLIMNAWFSSHLPTEKKVWESSRPLQDAGLVRWDHVLDVDEGVWAAATLQDLQGLLKYGGLPWILNCRLKGTYGILLYLDEVPDVLIVPLVVVDAVSSVHCDEE